MILSFGRPQRSTSAQAVQEFENAKPFNRVVRIVGGAKAGLCIGTFLRWVLAV